MIHIEAGEYTPEQIADILTNHMVENHTEKCLCCAESMKEISRDLSKNLVQGFRKMAEYVKETNENRFTNHLVGKMFGLNEGQCCNLNILQKHGLIAIKTRGSIDGVRGPWWVITSKGWSFLTGKISEPKTVYAFRNKKTIRVADDVRWMTIGEFEVEPFEAGADLFTQVPTSLDAVETARVFHKVKAKRRKNPCPNCPTGELKRRFVSDEILENTVRGHQEVQCNKCNYRAKEA